MHETRKRINLNNGKTNSSTSKTFLHWFVCILWDNHLRESESEWKSFTYLQGSNKKRSEKNQTTKVELRLLTKNKYR